MQCNIKYYIHSSNTLILFLSLILFQPLDKLIQFIDIKQRFIVNFKVGYFASLHPLI